MAVIFGLHNVSRSSLPLSLEELSITIYAQDFLLEWLLLGSLLSFSFCLTKSRMQLLASCGIWSSSSSQMPVESRLAFLDSSAGGLADWRFPRSGQWMGYWHRQALWGISIVPSQYYIYFKACSHLSTLASVWEANLYQRVGLWGRSCNGSLYSVIEYAQIQMAENTIRREVRRIVGEIDGEVDRIDRLLRMLAERQRAGKERAEAKDCKEGEWENGVAQQNKLNDTCEETDYSNTRAMSYSFEPIQTAQDEEMLLDHYVPHSIYVQEISLSQPKTISVPTKGSWINNFLDQSDSKVMFHQEGQLITLKDIKKGRFICRQGDHEQDLLVQSQKIYKLQNLLVQFPRHLSGYRLNLEVEGQGILYQLALQQRTRVLFECPNSRQQIIRFMLIREENEYDYEIVWGAYSEEAIFEPIILEPGTYILLPLPGDTHCNIYLENTSLVHIRKETVHPLKSFNLLKRSFEESRPSLGLKRTLSLISDDEEIKKEYGRSCYMNYGIILEFYENIYEHQAKFINQNDAKEDIELLFKEIYTADQISHRLVPAEKIFQFYLITRKPATLFIPKKRVLMGNRFMENKTIHSVFK